MFIFLLNRNNECGHGFGTKTRKTISQIVLPYPLDDRAMCALHLRAGHRLPYIAHSLKSKFSLNINSRKNTSGNQ